MLVTQLEPYLVTAGGFVKENHVKKRLDKLVKNAEAIDGVNKITFVNSSTRIS